jgi:hypothetical protein
MGATWPAPLAPARVPGCVRAHSTIFGQHFCELPQLHLRPWLRFRAVALRALPGAPWLSSHKEAVQLGASRRNYMRQGVRCEGHFFAAGGCPL